MMASEQKGNLPHLFQDKNRPCLSSWPEVGETGGILGVCVGGATQGSGQGVTLGKGACLVKGRTGMTVEVSPPAL